MKTPFAFLDRDGALIFEPRDTFQVDRVDLLQILPGVLEALKDLVAKGYKLVMVSNQDGRGTASFPEESFLATHNRFLEILKAEGIEFYRIFICPHFIADACECRKPKLGILQNFLEENEIDTEKSFMYGDRETDKQFANNLGIRFIPVETNKPCTITPNL